MSADTASPPRCPKCGRYHFGHDWCEGPVGTFEDWNIRRPCPQCGAKDLQWDIENERAECITCSGFGPQAQPKVSTPMDVEEEEVDIEFDLKTEQDFKNDAFYQGYVLSFLDLLNALSPKRHPQTKKIVRSIFKNRNHQRFDEFARAYGIRVNDPDREQKLRDHPEMKQLLYMVGLEAKPSALSQDEPDLSDVLDDLEDEGTKLTVDEVMKTVAAMPWRDAIDKIGQFHEQGRITDAEYKECIRGANSVCDDEAEPPTQGTSEDIEAYNSLVAKPTGGKTYQQKLKQDMETLANYASKGRKKKPKITNLDPNYFPNDHVKKLLSATPFSDWPAELKKLRRAARISTDQVTQLTLYAQEKISEARQLRDYI